jgi:hypothetical protein
MSLPSTRMHIALTRDPTSASRETRPTKGADILGGRSALWVCICG